MKEYIDLTKFYSVRGGKIGLFTIDCPVADEKNWRRPAVLIVPGGGYEHVSKREGATVACNFLARGFQCFVLEYLTVKDGVRYPEQLHELAAAVDYLKKNADVFHITKEEVFVLGFSAGGHLTANLGVDYFNVEKTVGERLDCKPTAIGLGYPVISTKFGYSATHNNLLNGYTERDKNELLNRLNLDNAVTEKTVPAFIWTTATDNTVPALNSIAFAASLAENKIRYELHVYPETDHGSSTCDFEVNFELSAYRKNARWLDDCASFFRLFTVEKY